MNDHYYTSDPTSESAREEIHVQIEGNTYHFVTDRGVFSKGELDCGTALLLETLELEPSQQVLDLGCGYGPIGIVAATKVAPYGFCYLVDVNARAVLLTALNLCRNKIVNAEVRVSEGFSALEGLSFDWILSNPPIRAGKEVVYALIEDSFKALKPKGGLLFVVRTKQGAKSMQKKIEEVFGFCETVKKRGGYRILRAYKTMN